jgi:hypothetical protein
MLRVNGFHDPLSSALSKLGFQRFDLVGVDRLNNAEQLLRCGCTGGITLADLERAHFQLLKICQHLIIFFFL